jgi:hypothetical protein
LLSWRELEVGRWLLQAALEDLDLCPILRVPETHIARTAAGSQDATVEGEGEAGDFGRDAMKSPAVTIMPIVVAAELPIALCKASV